MQTEKYKSQIENYEQDLNLPPEQRELRIKIVKDYMQVSEEIKKYNNAIGEFVVECEELISLTNNKFFINENLEYTKIAIKGFILESDMCELLKRKNIDNCTIKELNEFSYAYEEKSHKSMDNVRKALKLYKETNKLLNKYDNILSIIEKSLSNLIEYDRANKEKNYKELNNLLTQNIVDSVTFKYLNDLINHLYYLLNNGLILPI